MGLISYSSGLRHTIVQELQDGLSEEQSGSEGLRDTVQDVQSVVADYAAAIIALRMRSG